MTSALHTKTQGLRVHKLANLGGLIAIARLEEIDSAILLGALLEMAKQFSALSTQQLERLRAAGMQKLRERNSEKRVYQKQKDAKNSTQETTLNTEDIKKLIIKLGGKIPVLEKDWIPELYRLMR